MRSVRGDSQFAVEVNLVYSAGTTCLKVNLLDDVVLPRQVPGVATLPFHCLNFGCCFPR